MKKRISILTALSMLLSLGLSLLPAGIAHAADATLTVNALNTEITIEWDSGRWKAEASGGATEYFGTSDTLTITGASNSTEYTGSQITINGSGADTNAACNVTLKDIKLTSSSGDTIFAGNFDATAQINLGMHNAQLSSGQKAINVEDPIPLSITSTDTNSVNVSANTPALYAEGALTFNGTGRLSVKGGNDIRGIGNIAIFCNGLITVESGTLEATGGNGGNVGGNISCYGGVGISASELNILADASVTATGGNAGASDAQNAGGRGIHCNNISLAGNLKAVGGEKGTDTSSVGGSAIIVGTVVTFTDAKAVLEVKNGTDATETFTAKRADALKDSTVFNLENGATTAGQLTDQQITVTPPNNALGKVSLRTPTLTVENDNTTINITWDSGRWKAVATGGTTDTLLFGTDDTLTITGDDSSTEYTGSSVTIDGSGADTNAACNVTLKDIKLAASSAFPISARNFDATAQINLGMHNAQLSSTTHSGIRIASQTLLTITSTGTNNIQGPGSMPALDTEGSLTFNGSGTLSVKSSGEVQGNCAVFCNSGLITVESGTLEATGGNGVNGGGSSRHGGTGINALELNILAGASVTATGGNAGTGTLPNKGGHGVYCNNISLAGSLKAVGGEKSSSTNSVGGSSLSYGKVVSAVTFTDANAVLEVKNGTDNIDTFVAKRADALKDSHLFKLENGATTTDALTVQQITVSPPDNALGKVAVKKVQYTLTASAGENGSISPSGAVKVDHGDNQTFALTPDSGHEVDKLTVNGADVAVSGNSYTVNNVTTNGTIHVTFKKQDDDKEIKKPYYANIDEWKEEGGHWTATDEYGDKITSNWGWDESKQTWHYFNADGSLKVAGWVKTKDRYGKYHWYFLDKNGKMETGWAQIDGEWYYFDIPDGNMRTGWIQLKGKWYWLRKSGAMTTGYEQVSKRWSRFSNSGVWQGYAKNTGWKKYSKGWSFKANGSWVKNKWQMINGKWYLFDNAGYMRTGWVKSGSKWYHLRSSGAMDVNEWVKSGKSWYWVKANGSMAANESVTINGTVHSFDKNGKWIKGK